jgi:Predicted membrane protein
MDKNIKYVWKDKKRTLFGLPLSFTKYALTEEKLIIATGLLSSTEEEIRLYKITDFTLHRTLIQKMFGLGSIHICSLDTSTPEFIMKGVKNSSEVKELLSNMVEAERDKRGIVTSEYVTRQSYH